jgi:hypothetical protein
MNSYLWIVTLALFFVAAWFAWRHYDLQRRMDEYARLVRFSPEKLPTDVKELENLSIKFDLRPSTFRFRLR